MCLPRNQSSAHSGLEIEELTEDFNGLAVPCGSEELLFF